MKKLIMYASLLCLGMASCTKETMVPEGELPEWLGASIYEELKNPKSLTGTFNTYLKLIDDAGYDVVLSKTGSKTIFPANDEAFAAFFAGDNKFGKHSYEQLTEFEKRELLFSSMLDNAILVGTLSNKQNSAGNMLQGQVVKHPTNMRLTYSVTPWFSQTMPQNNKYFSRFMTPERGSMNAVFDNTNSPMVHFTREYMLNNNMTIEGADNDFYVLTGHNYEEGAAYIFDRQVIKSNVTCQNGYIHQLDGVLTNPGNMAQIIRSDKDLTLVSRMLDYYAFPQADMALTSDYRVANEAYGAQDTVFSIRYLSKNSQRSKLSQAVAGISVADNMLLDFDPGWNYYNPTLKGGSSGDDDEIAAILAPTDAAVKEYFLHDGKYVLKNLGVEGLDINESTLTQHLDAVYNSDPSIFTTFLNNVMKPYLTKTVPSKFSTVQNDAFEFIEKIPGEMKQQIRRKDGGIFDVTIGNNGVIYRMNKFFTPELYNSVLGPASVYKDMRTMGEMLNDHQVTAGVASKLGADMYYYLLSMKARYALFVPTDDDNSFIYVDPSSIHDADGLKGLRFRFDKQENGAFHILVKRYLYNGGPYNTLSSYSETADAKEYNIETGMFNTQIKDMLDYCTVVLADSTETLYGSPQKGLYGNRFYRTKHGGAIRVENSGNGIYVGGGLQTQSTNMNDWSKVTEVFDENSADARITNGSVYRLNTPIQPTITSVRDMLDKYTEFSDNTADYDDDEKVPENDHFLNFCSQFDNEDIYTFAGILTGNETAAQKTAKLKPYVVFDSQNNISMFSAYNYTLYAPTFAAMKEAQNEMGLPTWKTILEIVRDWESVAEKYGFATEKDASEYVKEKLGVMARFVRYHFQNSSVFADKYFKNYKYNKEDDTYYTDPVPVYSTFCTNQIGIAVNLEIAGGGNKLTIKDKSGKSVVVDGNSALSNILARDIVTEKVQSSTLGEYTRISSSSFVTIHGINTPLCYETSRSYK